MPLAITLVASFHTFTALGATDNVTAHRGGDVVVAITVATLGVELTLWPALFPSLTRYQVLDGVIYSYHHPCPSCSSS